MLPISSLRELFFHFGSIIGRNRFSKEPSQCQVFASYSNHPGTLPRFSLDVLLELLLGFPLAQRFPGPEVDTFVHSLLSTVRLALVHVKMALPSRSLSPGFGGVLDKALLIPI